MSKTTIQKLSKYFKIENWNDLFIKAVDICSTIFLFLLPDLEIWLCQQFYYTHIEIHINKIRRIPCLALHNVQTWPVQLSSHNSLTMNEDCRKITKLSGKFVETNKYKNLYSSNPSVIDVVIAPVKYSLFAQWFRMYLLRCKQLARVSNTPR